MRTMRPAQMVSDVDPAGTITVSWPSRPPLPQDTLRGGSGQRPMLTALAASALALLKVVKSPLEVRTQPLASAVVDTQIRPPRPVSDLEPLPVYLVDAAWT